METWKFYLLLIVPNLETISRLLASRDADNVGPDDRAARFLHYAATAANAILNDQPLPQLPASLAADIAKGK